MPSEPIVIHRLMVSRESLRVMATAINALSLEKERFVRLKDVVREALDTVDPSTAALPIALVEDTNLDGPIPVNLRLPKSMNIELDHFKQRLCLRIDGQCGVRETVAFCAMVIAKS